MCSNFYLATLLILEKPKEKWLIPHDDITKFVVCTIINGIRKVKKEDVICIYRAHMKRRVEMLAKVANF